MERTRIRNGGAAGAVIAPGVTPIAETPHARDERVRERIPRIPARSSSAFGIRNGGAAPAVIASVVVALSAIAIGLGGCAGRLERASSRDGAVGGRGAEQWDGGGGTWSLVMNSPRTEMMMAGVDASELPEYARNDDALGYREEGPVLASGEWPQRERPDLYYARRLQLETRADQVLFYDAGARYWGGYAGGSGSRRGGYEGGSGTWGFWR